MPNRDESLLTVTAVTATSLRIQDYLNAVAAHTGGDWAAHTTNNVYTVAYTDSHGDTVSPTTLRILGMYGVSMTPVTLVLAVPIVASGSISGSTGSAPTIIQQPVNTTTAKGGIATITVVAISATALTYQWQKQDVSNNWIDVASQTASSLVLTGVTTAVAGLYRCAVLNSYGSTYTNSAVLSIV